MIDIDWQHTDPDWVADYDDIIKEINEHQTIQSST